MSFDGVVSDRIFSIGFFLYLYGGSFFFRYDLDFWIVRFFHISFGCPLVVFLIDF